LSLELVCLLQCLWIYQEHCRPPNFRGKGSNSLILFQTMCAHFQDHSRWTARLW
jgi:hypothetical protein